MATEYISREAAIKQFCDDCMDREWCKSNGESCSRINNINAVPAADVRPVKHGEWELCDGDCAHCQKASYTTTTNTTAEYKADYNGKVVKIDNDG